MKVVLPAMAATLAVAAGVAGADAGQAPKGGPRDARAVMADIKAGKAHKLDTPSSKIRHTTGVWTGCEFVYLTTKVTDWETDLGERITVSEDPDAKPPKDKSTCPVDRNPTPAEMAAMRVEVAARNSAAGAGADVSQRPIPPEVIAAQNAVGTP
jgi:hypothetical protein